MAPNWSNRTVWTADCLYVLRGMNSESVDLIYLDPPFNSKANYAAPIGSKAAGAAFKDTWSLSDVDAEWVNLMESRHPALHRTLLAAMTDSDKSYLAYMAARVLEMHRVLKPTGAIYLHCDPTMSHYLKIAMDAIFGRKAFRNEITWRRTTGLKGTRGPTKTLGTVTDIVLFYGKNRHTVTIPRVKQETPGMRPFKHRDSRGVYRAVADLYGDAALHDCPKYEWNGHNPQYVWRVSRKNLEALHAANRIHYNRSGRPFRKQYRDEWDGSPISNLWADIPQAPRTERTGYPTQKPLKLLERVIKASSNEGDTVLDPFCGCATTMVAAESLGREWVGIDLSPLAVKLVGERLSDQHGVFGQIVARTDVPRRTDLGSLPAPGTHRMALYGLQGGDCAGCGEHFKPRHFEVDHIIARSKGGTDHAENLQLLCGHCNRTKGDRGMAYLKTKLQLGGTA